MLTVHFLVRKNPQEEKMSSPRFSLSSLASFLIRNDMTNFVYSCKPTQNSPRCISLDLESNFSFLISSAPYLPQSPDQFLMIQYFKRLFLLPSQEFFDDSFLVKMKWLPEKELPQSSKRSMHALNGWFHPLDHILDLNSLHGQRVLE